MHPFFILLFAATYSDVFLGANIPDAQVRMLIDLQFRSQCASYAAAYPDGVDHLVVVDGVQAGRLFTAESQGVIRLVDIALLPEFSGLGIGTSVVQGLIDRARLENQRVALRVIDANPAERLYERLGFVRTGTHGLHHEMVWRAVDASHSGIQGNAA